MPGKSTEILRALHVFTTRGASRFEIGSGTVSGISKVFACLCSKLELFAEIVEVRTARVGQTSKTDITYCR